MARPARLCTATTSCSMESPVRLRQCVTIRSSSSPARWPSLVVTAMSADRPQGTGDASEIMAMKHRDHPTYGVQFHPESIGTEHGKRILENFLRVVKSTGALV